MCREFSCECCPEPDLPQIICECLECYHEGGADPPADVPTNETQVAGSDPMETKPDLYPNADAVKSPCCSDKKENEGEEPSSHGVQNEEVSQPPCCKQKSEPCCSKGKQNSSVCNDTEEDKKPCCSSKKEEKEETKPCCSSDKERKPCSSDVDKKPCSKKEDKKPCSSDEVGEKKKPCCPSKKDEDKIPRCASDEDKKPCCSSKKEDKTPCCSSKKEEDKKPCSSDKVDENKKPCCSSKKEEDKKPCCSSDEDKKPCSSDKVDENKKPCCSSKKEDKKPCCSSKKEEDKKPCCSSKKEEEKKPCCSSKKEEETKPCSSDKVDENKKPCCSSKKEEDKKPCCSSKKEEDKKPCSSDEVDENKKPCCASDEDKKPRCSTKEDESSTCCPSNSDETKAPCCSSDQECCADEESSEESDQDADPADETQKLLDKSETCSVKSSVGSVVEAEGPQQTGKITTKLRVQNICCAMEAQLVKDCLAPLEGIENVAVNVIGRVVHVRHDQEVTSVRKILDTLNKVHLGATVMEKGDRHDEDDDGTPLRIKLLILYLGVQTVLFITAVVGLFLKTKWFMWVAIAEIVLGAVPIIKRALLSAKNLRVDINILMLIAIVGTLALSDWVEGATVVYIFALADALQEYSMFRVQRTISRLMLKSPQVAVLVETGECVDIESVAVGTLIAVRPGEMIPLDGIVVKGRASVDESSITGEALPVEKMVDSTVFSGTVDQNGYLEIKTTSDYNSSTVSKVAGMVQDAQSSSTQTEVIINRFAKYYTPLVVVVAALVIVVPAILGAAGVGTYSKEIPEWGRKALVLLVVACPCALVMSSPIAVVCSITAAARKGALIKGGEHLETLSKLEVLAFDKTGTLTEGKFEVTDIDCVHGFDERDVLRLAAGVENKSSHPIAAAIVNAFSGCVASMVKDGVFSIPEVKKFKMHEGRGISGNVEGRKILVGNRKLVEQGEIRLDKQMEQKFIRWSNESKTVVFVCVEAKLALMVALADAIRPNTREALYWLSHHGVQTSMITGDNARTAAAVKEQLGLDESVSEMKPGDKLEWIKDKQGRSDLTTIHSEAPPTVLCGCCRRKKEKYSVVGMVGDGVNDGPALAAADLGIAMGAGGTALAVEAADITLMSNNLAKIPELVSLGKFCRVVVMQNIGFSVFLKVILMVVALSGYVALWMAVVGDAFGLLFVIVNGLRPLIWQATNRKATVEEEMRLRRKSLRTFYLYESFV